MIKTSKKGVILPVKVVPRSAKNAIVGWENEELKVRLHAVPEKGEANAQLISFLAKTFKLPKTAFSLLSGETNRHKKLEIEGLRIEELNKIIGIKNH